MTVNDLVKQAKEEGREIKFIGVTGRDDRWADAQLEYPDEFLETEGDREVFDCAYQRTQKILVIKF